LNDQRPDPPQPLYITLTLVDSDANLLIAGLGKLPAEASYGLINRLVGELQRASATRDQQGPQEAPPGPRNQGDLIDHQEAYNRQRGWARLTPAEIRLPLEGQVIHLLAILLTRA
jgi:hypothetical protein